MSRLQNRCLRWHAVVAIATWCVVLPVHVCSGQIKLATDRPQPHTPEESARMMRLPDGLDVEIVASEPLLADPVDMAFDERGRIFVCEIHGYNLEGYYDILELNKTGVLDTEVRRIDASPEAQRRAAEGQYGTVKLLEDVDGDGRFDKADVWADHLPPCYGLVPARGGVVVLCSPDILFLADRDGDGNAEVREKLYEISGGPMWDRPSNPRWNLDNWIYYDGGYRFKADGSDCQSSTGKGQFGQAASDWGDRFYMVQVQPVRYVVPLPHRYLARNPYYGAKAGFVSLLPYNDVYPISQPHPWRAKRGADPAWLKFYGANEATPNGYVTSACGNVIYRGTGLPAEYRGDYFFCENAQNLIHRCLLKRNGASWRVERAREDKVEFLASPEIWFRPVNLRNGPDGALYIVDMYREIIEDYSAIPRFLQQQYVEALIAGHDRGRIWRLRSAETPPWRTFDLDKASTAELVKMLANPNAWWRETAQRLLVERGDMSGAEALRALVRNGQTPQARLHALCTLEGLETVRPEIVAAALADPHFAVRMHALRLSEPWLDGTSDLLSKVLDMLSDPDAKVRLQLALTLGESDDPRAGQALARLAVERAGEPWMSDAILSSVPDSADRLFELLVTRAGGMGEGGVLLHPLASIVGARHEDEQVGRLLAVIAATRDQHPSQVRKRSLEGLIEGLERGASKVLTSREGQEALKQLLMRSSSEIQQLSMKVAGLLKLSQSEQMQVALEEARESALNDDASVTERVAAVTLLGSGSFTELNELAGELLDPRQPGEVQVAVVTSLATFDNPEVGPVLLDRWPGYTPKVRDAVMEAILSSQNRLPALLDGLEDGFVEPSSLSAAQREQLLQNPDAALRRRAQAVLADLTAERGRADVLRQYSSALTLPRDAERGKEVFDRECAKCHMLQGSGYEVGPDLATTNTRSDETLISDVMDPSAEITVGYHNYTVITQRGRVFTGVLAGETATAITLLQEEAAESTILRKDIDEMVASPISMMPEDLEKVVTPQDVADLIAFLRQSLGAAAATTAPVVTLFDDDETFADILRQGDGTAVVQTEDRFSGEAALTVTPPQCFSLTIPGWEYRIAENPGPGEYRYLRFAWKSRGGHGVMIELGGGGEWPPADKPMWRYYSGQNTTGWSAVQVAPEAPEQWVMVTRDLWKDFGDFVLTGIAPTAMGGAAVFDRIELHRAPPEAPSW